MTCDRCKKVQANKTASDLSGARNWAKYEDFVFKLTLPVFTGDSSLYSHEDVDLCQECIRSLVTWLQGKEPDDA